MLVAVGACDETVAQTFTMAGKKPLAAAAALREGVALAAPEVLLLPALQEREQRRFADIAE